MGEEFNREEFNRETARLIMAEMVSGDWLPPLNRETADFLASWGEAKEGEQQ